MTTSTAVAAAVDDDDGVVIDDDVFAVAVVPLADSLLPLLAETAFSTAIIRTLARSSLRRVLGSAPAARRSLTRLTSLLATAWPSWRLRLHHWRL